MKSGPTLKGWTGIPRCFMAASSIEVNVVLPLLLWVPAMMRPFDFIPVQSNEFLKFLQVEESNVVYPVLEQDGAMLMNESAQQAFAEICENAAFRFPANLQIQE